MNPGNCLRKSGSERSDGTTIRTPPRYILDVNFAVFRTGSPKAILNTTVSDQVSANVSDSMVQSVDREASRIGHDLKNEVGVSIGPMCKVSCKMSVSGGCLALMPPVNDIITRDPHLLGGTPVFRGTCVPFQTMLDYLEGGQTLAEFLDNFPTVTREAAIAALEQAKTLLVRQLG